jgi:hypothetical protein
LGRQEMHTEFLGGNLVENADLKDRKGDGRII